jgi:glycosyltransferase involved in cell wall biosynthesis
MKQSQISIILPTRNRLSTIQRTVDRILAQTHQEWELVISDNASDEAGKVDYLESLAHSDPRIRLHLQSENIGIHKNWIFCIERVEGNYYIPITDDDWWGEDEFLAELLSMHDGKTASVFPNMCMHYTDTGVVREKVLTEVYSNAVDRYDFCSRLTRDRRGVVMVGLFDLGVITKAEIIAVIDNDLAAGIEVVGMNRISREYNIKYCDSVSYHHSSYGGNYCRSHDVNRVNQEQGIVGFRLLDDLRCATRSDEGFAPALQAQWENLLEYCREMAGKSTPQQVPIESHLERKAKLESLRQELRNYETSVSTFRGAVGLWWRKRRKRHGKKSGTDLSKEL